MIQLNDLTLGYASRILLQNVSTSFPRGKLIALLGRNGAGKSTLLRTLAGLNRPLAGEVVLSGRPLSDMNFRERARNISFVSTGQIRIPHFKCRDVVALGRAPYTDWSGKLRQADRQAVEQALCATGMEDYAEKTMDRMSDGECQRIMIARALAQDTVVILLDEPTSFLDLPNRYELGLLLRNLSREQDKCILFSTHELDIALSICDSIALIDTPALWHASVRKMMENGSLDDLFQNDWVAFDSLSQRVVFKK